MELLSEGTGTVRGRRTGVVMVVDSGTVRSTGERPWKRTSDTENDRRCMRRPEGSAAAAGAEMVEVLDGLGTAAAAPVCVAIHAARWSENHGRIHISPEIGQSRGLSAHEDLFRNRI